MSLFPYNRPEVDIYAGLGKYASHPANQPAKKTLAYKAPKEAVFGSANSNMRTGRALEFAAPVSVPPLAPQQAAIQRSSRRAHVGSGNGQQAAQGNADPMAAFLDMNQGYGTYAQPVSTGKLNYDQVAFDPNALNIDQVAFNPQSMNYGYAGNNNTDDLTGFLNNRGNYGTEGSSGSGSFMSGIGDWWGGTEGKPGAGSWLMGDKNTPGLIPMGVGLGTNIMNTYMGMQNYGLAKASMQDARDRYASDYAAQRTVVNNQIANKEASNAGLTGMSYADATSYGEKRAKEIGVA